MLTPSRKITQKGTGVSKEFKALAIDNTLHHLAFDNAAQANIIAIVSTGKIIAANIAACKLLGHSNKILLTKSRKDIFDINDSNFKNLLNQKFTEQNPTVLVTAIKKSGESFPCQITYAIFTEEGVEKSITTITDMSQSILEQIDIDTRKEKIVNDNIKIAKTKQRNIDARKEKIVANNIAIAKTKQRNIDTQKEKVVADDILEAKSISDARLTENNEWLKYISKTSTNTICDWNLWTGEIQVEKKFEKLFGYSPGNDKGGLLDRNNFIHQDDKDDFENSLQKAIDSNSSYWEHIYRFKRADGSLANVFERANIIRTEDGTACRIISVMQDISRHKQDEDGLCGLGATKNELVEKIKNIIVELIHYSNEPLQMNFSAHLSQVLEYDYTYLANLFSEVEGMPIRQYIILQKIEHVKELTLQDELSLTQIASKLHYSSVAHLSNQFKKVTGVTPSIFKQQKHSWQSTLQNV